MKTEDIPNVHKDELEELTEPLAELIFAGIDAIKALRETQEKNRTLLEKNYPHAGKIISCHLTIETLINTELFAIGKLPKNKFRKFTFKEKLEMLPVKGSLYCYFIPGITQVNKIRNEFAHKLDVIIKDEQMTEIDWMIKLGTRKEIKLQTIENRIEKFTIMCVGAFGTKHSEVMKPWKDFVKKNPHFENFLKKAGESIQSAEISLNK